jgi:bifunctional DNase/RNase
MWVEMSVSSIRVSLMNYQRVVILKEKDTDRYLPIWIGPAEAEAIAVKLQEVQIPRPLTHDLLTNIIKDLGAKLSAVVVSNLENDTFFAKLVLEVDGKRLEVDSRPSDAIALAVRTKAAIFVEDVVLEKAGIYLDKETGKPIEPPTGPTERKKPMDEEEMKKLSAFKEFIDSLDLGDFDKGKS